jgi:hypothetical protein
MAADKSITLDLLNNRPVIGIKRSLFDKIYLLQLCFFIGRWRLYKRAIFSNFSAYAMAELHDFIIEPGYYQYLPSRTIIRHYLKEREIRVV